MLTHIKAEKIDDATEESITLVAKLALKQKRGHRINVNEKEYVIRLEALLSSHSNWVNGVRESCLIGFFFLPFICN